MDNLCTTSNILLLNCNPRSGHSDELSRLMEVKYGGTKRRDHDAWRSRRTERCVKCPPNKCWSEDDPTVLSYFSECDHRWTVGWVMRNYERLDEEVWPDHDGPLLNSNYVPTKSVRYGR
jgi:hypothetical protein